jgi:hypothetical protein
VISYSLRKELLLTPNSISITGLVVLGGNTSIADPGANFRDAFAGTSTDANGLINALVRITFSYHGFQNCFNVMNEIKVSNVLSNVQSVDANVDLTRIQSRQSESLHQLR